MCAAVANTFASASDYSDCTKLATCKLEIDNRLFTFAILSRNLLQRKGMFRSNHLISARKILPNSIL